MAKQKKIQIKEVSISWRTLNKQDYISLTDMANWDGDPNARSRIQSWLKNGSTVRFLEIWEQHNNPDFNYSQMTVIKTRLSENAYVLTPKRWIDETQAIGIQAKAGRYGGTYAHRDIAFEFATWLSPEFKFYLITEFQRLKAEESDRKQLESRPVGNVSSPKSTTAYTLIPSAITSFPSYKRQSLVSGSSMPTKPICLTRPSLVSPPKSGAKLIPNSSLRAICATSLISSSSMFWQISKVSML